MSTQKRHHVVPRMLLKHFADERGYLFARDRRTPARGVFAEHFDKFFIETHLYSYRADDGSRDPAPERELGKVEAAAGPVIEAVITSARGGTFPPLADAQRAALDDFAYRQWKRAPEVLNRLSLEDFHATIDRSLAEIERQIGPLPIEQRAHFVSEQYRARAFHNAKLDAMLSEGPEVLKALAGSGLYIAVISHRRRSFIVGSFPVTKLSRPGDGRLGGPATELWLPIAHDIAVVWHGPPAYRLVDFSDMAAIRNTNEAIARQSTIIAGRSRELVASVTEAAWSRVAPRSRLPIS